MWVCLLLLTRHILFSVNHSATTLLFLEFWVLPQKVWWALNSPKITKGGWQALIFEIPPNYRLNKLNVLELGRRIFTPRCSLQSCSKFHCGNGVSCLLQWAALTPPPLPEEWSARETVLPVSGKGACVWQKTFCRARICAVAKTASCSQDRLDLTPRMFHWTTESAITQNEQTTPEQQRKKQQNKRSLTHRQPTIAVN